MRFSKWFYEKRDLGRMYINGLDIQRDNIKLQQKEQNIKFSIWQITKLLLINYGVWNKQTIFILLFFIGIILFFVSINL